MSPSESAGLGWGGPHSLRWEGGSALVLHPRPSPSSRAVTHAALCSARVGPAPRHLLLLGVFALALALVQLLHLRRARRARGTAARSSAPSETVSLFTSMISTTPPRLVRLSVTSPRAPLRAPSRAHACTCTRTARYLRRLQRSRLGAPRTTLLHSVARARGRRLRRGQMQRRAKLTELCAVGEHLAQSKRAPTIAARH